MPEVTLKRGLGLALITFYGLGNILGAGIYVLIGEIAGKAGYHTPIAFLVAALVAAVTALSYAEMSARLPLSAGEAVYLQEGFGVRWLSVCTGLLIAFAGLVSAATLARGFIGYFQFFIDLPDLTIVIGLILILGALAGWDITKAVGTAAVFTIIEISGLVLIIAVSGRYIMDMPDHFAALMPSADPAIWFGIFAGAFLAFYAYIGFEDMVNVAEEVKNPHRNLPRGIILALVISSILYLMIALIAVLSINPAELATSKAPLAMVYQHNTGKKPDIISLISLFAIINGILIQIIMSSRIIYGVSRQGWIHPVFSRIHPVTRTPLIATSFAVAGVLVLAAFFSLTTLAKATSYVILVVFCLVNLALIKLKRRIPDPDNVRTYPPWVPYLGFALCLGLIGMEIYSKIRDWTPQVP